MSGSFRFVVSSSAERVDRLVADATGCGRRTVRRWLAGGRVRVNGHLASAAERAGAGSEIVVEREEARPPAIAAPLAILLENEQIVAVAKPAGLHSVRGRSEECVAALLEQRYGDLSHIGESAGEAGLVHRLDRDTSGLLVAAKSRQAYVRLRRAFGEGRTRKHYLALAAGRLDQALEVDLPLARRATRMVPASRHDRPEDVLEARTILEPLDGGGDWSLVLATMHTGVMHQIRAHMAAAGHPLLGDVLYGGAALEGSQRRGQLLHALRLEVDREIDVTIGPPEDFLASYARLRRRGR